MIAINMELHRVAVSQAGSTKTEEEINPIYHGTAQILSSFTKTCAGETLDHLGQIDYIGDMTDKIWEVLNMYKPLQTWK